MNTIPSSTYQALVNRHEITDERSSFPPTHNRMDELIDLLANFVAEPNINEELIAMNPGMLQPGSRIEIASGINRRVLIRTAIPPNNLTIPTTGAIIYQDNPNRIGGAIVNTGTNALQLVLGVDLSNNTGAPMGGAAQVGYGAIWLSSAGGSWNFKLTDILWGGSVYGYG